MWENGSVRELIATVCIGEGEIPLGLLPAGGSQTWPVPDDRSLDGLEIEIKLYDINGLLIKKTMTLRTWTVVVDDNIFEIGDVDQNGSIDILDMLPFIDVIGGGRRARGINRELADLDFDGDVDFDDLASLVERIEEDLADDS